MDQKNTIIKCMANPDCLFNHNGICDNYVITIGADGSCQEYVETEEKDWPPSIEQILQRTIDYELEQKDQMCWYCDNGKHGKCKFIVKPLIAPNGECCRFTSTGGNR